ncbi:hypothetical protein IQ276_010660 [Desmonostoc muscorum LEGE 12446]|uniref:hypothetical protein n=1 Tax=Desmonostoc muscorum TaxID=1179 RepID=UPI001D15082E|nr:hypothetical protein [Desmonostoc muscorum]MCF2146908.1 hypothetical protein [Desmonostoc muscorum LEGE 12446]
MFLRVYRFCFSEVWLYSFVISVFISLDSAYYSQELAEAIRNWYINHEDVRDAVLLEEREIEKVSKTQPESQENTPQNRYRVLQDELQKLQDRKTVAPGQNQP